MRAPDGEDLDDDVERAQLQVLAEDEHSEEACDQRVDDGEARLRGRQRTRLKAWVDSIIDAAPTPTRT